MNFQGEFADAAGGLKRRRRTVLLADIGEGKKEGFLRFLAANFQQKELEGKVVLWH